MSQYQNKNATVEKETRSCATYLFPDHGLTVGICLVLTGNCRHSLEVALQNADLF